MPHRTLGTPPIPGTTPPEFPTLLVSPAPGMETLGSAPPYSVELLLFGYPPVMQTVPTFAEKFDLRMSYAFSVPQEFVSSPTYTCGNGTHLSEVRVTDKNGLKLSKTFELCPDQDATIPAEIVVP